MSTTGRWACVVYVSTVAALAADSFDSAGNTFTAFPEGLLFLVLLPALVPMLPLVYLGGAFVWSLTDADTGGPMWPVTVLYVLMFASVAVVNVVVVRFAGRLVTRWWGSRRGGATPSTYSSPGAVRGGGGQS